MNVALWIIQALLGLAFTSAGSSHAFRVDQMKTRPGMGWVTAVPRRLMTFIGICEVLGAVGLILPTLTGILPWLTPLVAALLAVIMLLAAGFHIPR